MRRALGGLAGLVVLAALVVEPAAAARRSTLTNASDLPVRICLTAVGCSKSKILLKPGQNSRQVLGTKKLRALYVPNGWRAVVVTKGQRVAYRGPATVRLPTCYCRRTVSKTRVPPMRPASGSSRLGPADRDCPGCPGSGAVGGSPLPPSPPTGPGGVARSTS